VSPELGEQLIVILASHAGTGGSGGGGSGGAWAYDGSESKMLRNSPSRIVMARATGHERRNVLNVIV
jgi:hypothetical protein